MIEISKPEGKPSLNRPERITDIPYMIPIYPMPTTTSTGKQMQISDQVPDYPSTEDTNKAILEELRKINLKLEELTNSQTTRNGWRLNF